MALFFFFFLVMRSINILVSALAWDEKLAEQSTWSFSQPVMLFYDGLA